MKNRSTKKESNYRTSKKKNYGFKPKNESDASNCSNSKNQSKENKSN